MIPLPSIQRHRPLRSGREQRGFTLIELLVAMTIFVGIMLTLFTTLELCQKSWSAAQEQLSQFRESRAAFGKINRHLTDATLKTYWDYEYPNGNTSAIPDTFVRQSELHFVSGPASVVLAGNATSGHAVFFHGPFGLHNQSDWRNFSTLLNGWGYYVEFGAGAGSRPPFISNATGDRFRFRLMELQVPAEILSTYNEALKTQSSGYNFYAWFQDQIAAGYGRVLAENVIALVITPEAPEETPPTGIAPAYLFDSRAFQQDIGSPTEQERSKHQLPPLLRMTMVVIDETSAVRLQQLNDTSAPNFGLGTLFQVAENYAADLAALETTLQGQNINYRVFSSMIRLRNARWSTEIP